MNEKEKMISGELYNSSDKTLLNERIKCKELLSEFNQVKYSDFEKRNEIYLSYVEAKSPKGSWLKPLFHAFIVGGGICVFGQMVGDMVYNVVR